MNMSVDVRIDRLIYVSLTYLSHFHHNPTIPQGYGATLLSFGPFSAFYFLFYEQFKHLGGSTLGVPTAELPFHWTLARSVPTSFDLITYR